jgi:sec-independent protein translocase protein TatC
MGVVTADFLKQKRRYAILLIFIIAAFLTPPDVISQFLMAIPLMALYEFSILIAKLAGKKKKVSSK